MTIERKHTLSIDDIKAFEITCVNCATTLSIPLENCNKTTFQCPRCTEYWYAGGAAENEAITGLASSINEVRALSRQNRSRSLVFA